MSAYTDPYDRWRTSGPPNPLPGCPLPKIIEAVEARRSLWLHRRRSNEPLYDVAAAEVMWLGELRDMLANVEV